MTTILLIRHAVNDFVKTGKLAGWTPGVHLNEAGIAQAEALGARLAGAPLNHLYASPIERTMETAAAIAAHHPQLTVQACEQIGEVRYGAWQGKSIAELAQRKMWAVVQEYPSRAVFPEGETMRGVQTRIVEAIETLVRRHPNQLVALVFHADLIKMCLAHYLGMHLDVFQRIVISPASISTLQLGHSRPFIVNMNDTAHLQALKSTGSKADEQSPRGGGAQ
ncbi:MAG: MSMEG_4193 family putative phosphomutase [Chloroflexi bacterium]|nr:MSMEG_4193 family putative phosphomutase [Chloroflexota bacterium]MCY3582298.1 MSMEG_4193 family putative phosphomutase [Chloroflexota bacterium]MCY3716162.1 MSMEG_4193 family putative phosphomutase [Chloroflexota bacterium]MDE2650946.1 MSMEG_4193 family putative phosphomutase [Chloroflexota bacterium]MXX82148.1 MSMEG_4193 family putative phosphomutase [Chloroflexota bacterium]